MSAAARIDIGAVKAAAAGRWVEILSIVGGIDRALLDGKHHPCPRCGGTDRFRMIDVAAGALFCNQCFSSGNGDGVAAVRWLRQCDFPTALRLVAEHLGVNGSVGGPIGTSRGNGKPHAVYPTAAAAIAELERRHGRSAARWTYHDATGAPVGVVVRWDRPDGTKDIRPVSLVDGGWTIGGMPEPRPLYRLPALADAARVYVCEGEKAADAACSIGLVATTSPHGCKSARRADWTPLSGKEVVILPDNDQPGREYRDAVAGILRALTPPAKVRVVELPGLPPAGDIADWLDARGTVEELGRLVKKTPEWTSPPSPRCAGSSRAISPDGDHFPLTDSGNAERLVHLHGGNLRYCYVWRKWLAWDGRRWVLDADGQAQQCAKATARAILREAAECEDKDERNALIGHARRSESAGGRAAMLRCAESEPGIPVQPAELDRDAWLLNVENGTVDLRSGGLRAHEKKDMLTKLAPCVFDADATCPTWERFLSEILGGDAELVGFVQRFLGYCLTGDVSEQILTISHGVGANGKSTLVNAILDVLGDDYSLKASSDMLLAKRGMEHPTALTDLHGKRLVACIETDEGRRLAEAMAKELTGGDPIRARRMREDFWQFWPTHKILLACKHKPTVRGTDRAIWRRIKLVPFGVVIPPDRRDKDLPAKLRAERSGILAWLVRGCLDWQREGLGEPAAVVAATADYAADEDALGQFLHECCTVTPGARVRAADLADAYRQWSGDGRLSVRKLTRMLTERGIDRYTNNGVWYRGVGLSGNGITEQRNEFSY